jgi:hypothetical protein
LTKLQHATTHDSIYIVSRLKPIGAASLHETTSESECATVTMRMTKRKSSHFFSRLDVFVFMGLDATHTHIQAQVGLAGISGATSSKRAIRSTTSISTCWSPLGASLSQANELFVCGLGDFVMAPASHGVFMTNDERPLAQLTRRDAATISAARTESVPGIKADSIK